MWWNMNTITEEDLILYHFGELDADRTWAVEQALDRDPSLREQLADLRRTLSTAYAPVPEPDVGFEQRVRARVLAQLPPRGPSAPVSAGWRSGLLPQLTVPLGAVAVLTLVASVAFMAGRSTGIDPTAAEGPVIDRPSAATDASGADQRLLYASVARHLEGSEQLLLELANADTGDVDLEAEQDWAQVLLTANRLYQFAAERAGQPRIAELLADMEPVLIALANGELDTSSEHVKGLRERIRDENLILKTRTTQDALVEEEETST